MSAKNLNSPLFKAMVAALLLVIGCDSNEEVPLIAAEPIKTMVNAKIKVGQFLYENVDAMFTVKGYSSSEELKWTKDFEYTGGEDNILELDGGYHHYEVTLKKWGIEDSQVFTSQQLHTDRADGPSATTYIFGGEVDAKRLRTLVSSMERNEDGIVKLVPNLKEIFEWTDGQLSQIRDFEFDEENKLFIEKRYYNFKREGGKVTSIKGYQKESDNFFLETSYQYYPDGNVSQIIEKNMGAGTSTTVNLTYDFPASTVNAVYTFANGSSFTYSYLYKDKNIVSDKVVRSGTLCNEGTYEHDKNINPFRHLGYVDPLLTYVSINNKMNDDVSYKACSFPEVTVESYDFEYDEDGYPTREIRHFSNGMKGETLFEYQ